MTSEPSSERPTDEPALSSSDPSAGTAGEETSASRRASRRQRFMRVAGIALVVYLGVNLGLSIWWSREPPIFDTLEEARTHAIAQKHIAEGADLPMGYHTVHTAQRLIDTLLDKPGGLLVNDMFPPATYGAVPWRVEDAYGVRRWKAVRVRWLDNIPNWEYGALVAVRDIVLVLMLDMTRYRGQSEGPPEIRRAFQRINIDHTSWILPSAESQYTVARDELEAYLEALSRPGRERAPFFVRQDNLAEYFRYVERRLGETAIALRASAGDYLYDPRALTSFGYAHEQIAPQQTLERPEEERPQWEPPLAGREEVLDSSRRLVRKTPWLEIDDVFFEARGTAFALYHLLLAVRDDFEQVIDGQRAMGQMNRALSELHAALQPIRTPMIMAGRDYSITPNHSITLAAYLAQAHLAVADLRSLMSMGSPAGPPRAGP